MTPTGLRTVIYPPEGRGDEWIGSPQSDHWEETRRAFIVGTIQLASRNSGGKPPSFRNVGHPNPVAFTQEAKQASQRAHGGSES